MLRAAFRKKWLHPLFEILESRQLLAGNVLDDPTAYFAFDENSGTTAGGGGPTGVVQGASWTVGQSGAALDFDGVNDHVDLGALNIDDGASGMAISAWVKSNNVANNDDSRIVSKATGAASQNHYWMLSTFDVGSESRLRFRLKTGNSPSSGTTTLIASSGALHGGQWHHVVATYDGGNMQLYLDGQEVGSVAKSGTVGVSNSVDAWIGGNPSGEAWSIWDGAIDEVQLYSRGLTGEDVQTLFAGESINNPPTIEDAAFNMAENSLAGTVLGAVTGTDPDGDTLNYQITAGNDGDAFAIDAITGELTVNNANEIDFEATPTFHLTVRASDGQLSDTALVTVNLTNVNEAPVFAATVGDLHGLPVLGQNDLDYVGAFRVPSGPIGSSTFDYGGTALAFNPQNNSLFLVGHDHHQAIAEIAIPDTIVNSSQVNDLATANVLQSFTNVLSQIPNYTLEGNVKVGGLMVVDGQLIGTAYEYYDGDADAVESHFRYSSLDLSTANLEGFFRVGTLGGGFVGGYMTSVPDEWRGVLGAPYLTGQAALAVIGRTSSGPAAFGFDPQDLGAGTAPTSPYVYYPQDHVLAPWGSTNPLFNGTTEITGVMFAPETRSVLFFGSHGTGPFCYGTPDDCNDPSRGGQGTHSHGGQYEYQVWAYDALDFVAVKNGTLQPWELQPYDVWNYQSPIEASSAFSGGVAFDAQTRRLYVPALRASPTRGPVIHVYEIDSEVQPGGNGPFRVGNFAANGTVVGTVAATDPDAGDQLTYSITGGNVTGAFVIDPSTGEITVANSAALDPTVNPSFELALEVTDTGGLTDTTTVTINIGLENLGPTIAEQTFSVDENAANGVAVGTTIANDPDGDSLTYAITAGDNGVFAVNPTTGAITVANGGALDYEAAASHSFTVRVSDGQLTDAATITINLNDLNEAPTVNNQTFSIAENAAVGALAGNVVAFDPDASDTLSFAITAGNVDNAFTMNAATGAITVANSAALDPTSHSIFQLVVQATDSGGLTDTANVTINVNADNPEGPFNYDNPPPLPPPDPASTINVSSVTQLIDAVNNLQSGQTISIAEGVYNLTGHADALYVPQGITNWAIRGATGNRDDVVIQGAGVTGGVRFGFWISNSTQGVIADLTIDGVREHGVIANTGSDGLLVHNMRIVDSGDQFVKSNPVGYGNGNDGGVVQYSVFEYRTTDTDDYTNGVDVHGGDGWRVHHNLFRNFLSPVGEAVAGPAVLMWNGSSNSIIEGNTFLNVSRGISLGLIDHSSGNDHQGGIIRNNFFYRDAGLPHEVDAPIFVGDSPNTKVHHNTLITQGSYPNAIEYRFASSSNLDIKNNLTDGAIVARDGATAQLAGNVTNASLSLFVNPPVGNLHLVSGASVINQGVVVFETTDDIDEQSRDAAPDVGADEFHTVTPENARPEIQDQIFSVEENAAGGTVVGTVSAIDPNGDELTFSITGGNDGEEFTLDADTGVLTVAPGASLNHETTASFLLVVQVSDGQLSAAATVTVNVTDVNESPDLLAHFPFDEGSGSSVSGGEVSGSVHGANWTTGYYGAALHFDGSNDYVDLGAVDVADRGGLSVAAWIKIDDTQSIADRRIVSKATGVSEQQHYWMLSTVDAGGQSRLRFRLKTGDFSGSGTTTLIASAGNLQTGDVMRLYLDGQEVGSTPKSGLVAVNNNVSAWVGGNPSGATVKPWDGAIDEVHLYNRGLTSDEVQSLFNTEVNNAPTIEADTFSVNENVPSGTIVGTTPAVDPDGDAFTFSIISGNDDDAFMIDANTGVITVAPDGSLDHESTPSYALTVQVSDGALSNSATVTINVLDVNESPAISAQTFSVDENSAAATVVGTVAASDQDRDSLTFSITAGNDEGAFAIDVNTGVVTVAEGASLDYESTPLYALTVQVSDGLMSVSAAVTIDVEDVGFEGVLMVSGTAGADQLSFYELDAPGSARVQYQLNGVWSEIFEGVQQIIARGGEGNDVISIEANALVGVEFHGGHGDDELYGGEWADALHGDEGEDFLDGLGGDDYLLGGVGNDLLIGSSGDDRIEGQDGRDVLDGKSGADILRGGDGRDRLEGGEGNDIMIGGADLDRLFGQFGNNVLIGGEDFDYLDGNFDIDEEASVNPQHASILIGGATVYDEANTANDEALSMILAEWSSGHHLADRMANILNGSGAAPGLNGPNYLGSSEVFDDNSFDLLSGGDGRDFFWSFGPSDILWDVEDDDHVQSP